MKCPKCGEEMTCDMVDVGVGEIQSSPYGCENCGYVQPGAEDMFKEREPLYDDPETACGQSFRSFVNQAETAAADHKPDAFTCDEDNRPSRDDDDGW